MKLTKQSMNKKREEQLMAISLRKEGFSLRNIAAALNRSPAWAWYVTKKAEGVDKSLA